MKKSTKKLVSVLLASAMAAGMLAGCGSGNGKGSTGDSKSSSAASGTSGDNLSADTSEHVDLTMYLIGDRTPDFDEVYAKINEILEEKLNCSLNVEFLSWGEHDTKYSLLFSSQEDFDLIFTASSWCHYEQTVSLGGFAPLSEDFIKTYAPDIWEVVPEMAWEQAKIDGQIYMVPSYANEFGQEVLAVFIVVYAVLLLVWYGGTAKVRDYVFLITSIVVITELTINFDIDGRVNVIAYNNGI